MKLLTDETVEARLLERVRLKASTYGQDPAQKVRAYKIDPEVPVKIYKDFLIPLTKEVELEYILRRLDGFSVAYHGSIGSLSYVATKEYFTDTSALIPYSTIPQVFSAVLSCKADYGVVPSRNTHSGLYKETHEICYKTDAKIIGEIHLPVRLQLVSITRDLSKLTKIYCHPDDLSQCFNSLLKYCPGIQSLPVSSSTEAAQRAAADPTGAAICHLDILKHFPGLQVARPDIQDDDNSFTEFFILSRTSSITPSGRDKTVLVFGVNNRPGGLSSALGSFEKHQTNLVSIQSDVNGKPEFLIEIEGHFNDVNVTKALEELRNHTTFMNILGSFASTLKKKN
jgi:chorismate mutase/prephenate dehydratase